MTTICYNEKMINGRTVTSACASGARMSSVGRDLTHSSEMVRRCHVSHRNILDFIRDSTIMLYDWFTHHMERTLITCWLQM